MKVSGEFRGIEKNTVNGKEYFNINVEEKLGHPLRIGIKNSSKYDGMKPGSHVDVNVGVMAKVSKAGQPYCVIWEI